MYFFLFCKQCICIWNYNVQVHLDGVFKNTPCTINIFGSKCGHLNNSKNCKVFFILHKMLLYFMIFPSSAAYLALSTLKNRQIVVLQKSWRKWRKIFELLLLLKWPLWEQEMFTVPCILKYSLPYMLHIITLDSIH